MKQIDVHELKAMQDAGEDFLLLDVRTSDELARASLPGAVHIPLHVLEARANELKAHRDKEIVCMCHHGGRSAAAQMMLQQQGYSATNLAGGIDAWSREVDPSVPRYG